MNSQEKRRDTEKLQNKRRRQKWHFLRDCCVAFVGRKMKCEDQREMEGGRGHGENRMSKSKKQKRKCVRGKTNLWEMRQESARLSAAVWWIRWGWRWGGGARFLQVGGQRRTCDMDPLRRHFKKKKKKSTLQKWEMNIKQNKKKKNITSLWKRISLAGR